MFHRCENHRVGRALGLVAVTIAVVGFVNPGAAGVSGSAGGGRAGNPDESPGTPLRSIVRVERTFHVRPHSLATNQIVRCPRGTSLTGGGTSLVGEPSSPRTAPVVYTNGPVGDILPGEAQSWASEVANTSAQPFTYTQFALCARGTHHSDDD